MMEYILFGESHGPAVGVLLRGVPAGLPVDEKLIRADLLRRKASGGITTSRVENDEVEFLSGVFREKPPVTRWWPFSATKTPTVLPMMLCAISPAPGMGTIPLLSAAAGITTPAAVGICPAD